MSSTPPTTLWDNLWEAQEKKKKYRKTPQDSYCIIINSKTPTIDKHEKDGFQAHSSTEKRKRDVVLSLKYTELFFRSRIKPHRFVTDSQYEMCLCIIETQSPDGGSLTTGYQPATAASPGALINDRSQHIKYTRRERCYGGLQKRKCKQFL